MSFCLSSRSRTMDVSVGVPCHPAKEKPPINVVGDVGGRIAIMVVSSNSFSIVQFYSKLFYDFQIKISYLKG